MNATTQTDTDATKIAAALHGLQKVMGAERFEAAQAAVRIRWPSISLPASRAVARPKSPNAQHAASPPSEDADVADTLALARSAGVGRFGAEQGVASPPCEDASIAETLALARAAGIGRFGSEQSVASPPREGAPIADTLELARGARVGRFGADVP